MEVVTKLIRNSTVETRSRERYRRAALTTLASAAAQGTAILTSLISVPLALNYLGSERYGLWMTVGSLVALLQFADLGIGLGLLNAVSEANGKNDREVARIYVSSAFFLLSGVALSMATIFASLYPWVSWWQVFNVSSSQAVVEAGPAIAVFFACFAANIVLSIARQTQMGYQEGFISSTCIGLSSLVGLGGILLAIRLEAGLSWLVLSIAGAPLLASLLNSISLFGFQRPWLRPKWASVRGEAAKKILRLGVLFFVLQIAVALAYSSDNIIVAQVFGPEAVTEYSIPWKMFNIITVFVTLALSPLWPAYGESIVRGDFVWVKKTLLRSLIGASLFAGVIAGVLVVFGKQIITLWVGSAVTSSFMLLLGLGVWTVIAAAGSAVSMLLNAANIVRFQVICALLMCSSAVILKLVLAHSIGLPGIIWGTIIAYVVCSAIPTAIVVPRLVTDMRTGGWQQR